MADKLSALKQISDKLSEDECWDMNLNSGTALTRKKTSSVYIYLSKWLWYALYLLSHHTPHHKDKDVLGTKPHIEQNRVDYFISFRTDNLVLIIKSLT